MEKQKKFVETQFTSWDQPRYRGELVLTIKNPADKAKQENFLEECAAEFGLKVEHLHRWQKGKSVHIRLKHRANDEHAAGDRVDAFVERIQKDVEVQSARPPMALLTPGGTAVSPSTIGGPADEASCPPAEDVYSKFDPSFVLDPETQKAFDAKLKSKTRRKKDVVVYVFDTSPYGDSPQEFSDKLANYAQYPFAKHFYNEGSAIFTLDPALTADDKGDPAKVLEMSAHGIFVASIIQLIAPDAKIVIKPILGRDGDSPLPLLESEVEALTDETKNDLKTQYLINISAMVEYKDIKNSDVQELNIPDLTEAEKNGIKASYFVPDSTRTALKDWMKPNNRRVIAAAGNDGIDSYEKPWPSFPARLDGVLSVGATDRSGEPTDYSNLCNIPTQTLSAKATSLLQDDEKSKNGIYVLGGSTRLGLFGLYMPDKFSLQDCPDGDPVNHGGFAQWAGTSFATAVATGYMAYLCGKGMTAEEARLALLDLPNGPGDAPTLRVQQQ